MWRDFLRLRIVHGEMAPGGRDRIELRGRMRRTFLAEIGIRRGAHGRRDPDAPFFIKHRVVDIVLARPDRFFAPVRRRLRHRRRRGRCLRIANGELHLAGGVVNGIEHGQIVGTQLERSVDQTVRVERGIATVGGHLVVQVGLRIRPVPLGDHDVTLDALRTRRRGRHFTAGDAIGPVGKHLQRAILAHLIETTGHLRAGLP